ncbi:hypothetical protein G7066_02825 [Leucobacter coleopterorum]|uniref:Regulator of chromosome condensation (RCC1) repeat-containing protein n=1 Tax=Leucobacter coleopterorum TaxID=2714933 RepID=A0ABX6JUD2_9MICO|nr:hypothetical protein [Leucobacter coleopterorum]QIM17882.1 hypothetical protein G7066_02825 [Leucobacter coleopterorum]
MLKRTLSAVVSIGLVAGMVSGAAVSAQADPVLSPDNGIAAGGETVSVPGPDDLTFTQVESGLNHSVAIGSDGKTYAWGLGLHGEMGDGGTRGHTYPTPVTNVGVAFTQVSVGGMHSLGLGTDGNVYAWGMGGSGQLGNGTTETKPTPTQVSVGGVTFTQVSAGQYFSLALGSDGNIYAWATTRTVLLAMAQPPAGWPRFSWKLEG